LCATFKRPHKFFVYASHDQPCVKHNDSMVIVLVVFNDVEGSVKAVMHFTTRLLVIEAIVTTKDFLYVGFVNLACKLESHSTIHTPCRIPDC
jgi:hypothetical protein